MSIKQTHHIFLLFITALLQGCGLDFASETSLQVKTVGERSPACKSELCDKDWQEDLFALVDSIKNNRNIVPIFTFESNEKVIDVKAGRAMELRGFKLVDAAIQPRYLLQPQERQHRLAR